MSTNPEEYFYCFTERRFKPKTYPCRLCGRCFTYSETRGCHENVVCRRRTISSKEEDEPYKCTKCDFVLMNSNDFDLHTVMKCSHKLQSLNTHGKSFQCGTVSWFMHALSSYSEDELPTPLGNQYCCVKEDACRHLMRWIPKPLWDHNESSSVARAWYYRQILLITQKSSCSFQFWTIFSPCVLLSFDQDMRGEKTLIQTLACQLSSTLMQLLFQTRTGPN